ncbi:MAG: hypothetical protein LRY69_02045 [Gammaproteobacteria bacterium]|nr:hypothetical protein [Gammaproteobacteria bacterium]
MFINSYSPSREESINRIFYDYLALLPSDPVDSDIVTDFNDLLSIQRHPNYIIQAQKKFSANDIYFQRQIHYKKAIINIVSLFGAIRNLIELKVNLRDEWKKCKILLMKKFEEEKNTLTRKTNTLIYNQFYYSITALSRNQ